MNPAWQRHMVLVSLLFLLVGLSGAGMPAEQGATLAAPGIQGVWRAVFAEGVGVPSPKGLVVTVTEKTFAMRVDDKAVVDGKYTLDPKRVPPAIGLVSQGQATPGIYQVAGNTLRVCLGSGRSRPASFAGSDTAMFLVLVRGQTEEKIRTIRTPDSTLKPAANPAGRSFVNQVLGCEPVDGVAESGFSYQEANGSEPFRWTNGAAKLPVPLGSGPPPQSLWVSIETYRARPGNIPFKVLVDNKPVFDGSVPLGRWERFFDLRSRTFAKHVEIDIRSSTFVPKGLMDGGTNTDTRTLDVQVKGILLRRDK